ncbi:MAG TPA: NADH-ubiquinone oxidoreductase-F iron-sulfur binding region domain-containing protein, partial [Candidatus Limnocylindria bacterium]
RKMADTALCKLEARAPGPMLTTLERFPEEYRAHAERGECLSGFHANVGVTPLISPLSGIEPASSAHQ